jgi:hypothetical protein
MKKSELKNIIKECVKEVIFEEGVLSGIVLEVTKGLGGSVMTEQQEAPLPSSPTSAKQTGDIRRQILESARGNNYEEAKKRFSNPELFEGTRPITESKGQAALSGIAPADPGVEIANLPGFGTWSHVAISGRK